MHHHRSCSAKLEQVRLCTRLIAKLCILNCELFVPSLRYSFERLLLAPAAGYRNREDGILTVVGTYGEWWSSSAWSDEVHHASHLAGTSEKVCPHDSNGARAYAFSVRCVQASADCRSAGKNRQQQRLPAFADSLCLVSVFAPGERCGCVSFRAKPCRPSRGRSRTCACRASSTRRGPDPGTCGGRTRRAVLRRRCVRLRSWPDDRPSRC